MRICVIEGYAPTGGDLSVYRKLYTFAGLLADQYLIFLVFRVYRRQVGLRQGIEGQTGAQAIVEE